MAIIKKTETFLDVRVLTWLRAGGSWIQMPKGARDF
jgi:hypothetical protein